MKNRESIALSASRWTAYSAAGIAAATAGTMTSEAEAGITASGIINVAVNQGSTQVFALAGSAAFIVGNVALGPYSSGGVALAAVAAGSLAGFSSGFPYASNLAYGAALSAANFGIASSTGTLAYGFGYSNSGFVDTDGYVGFRFDIGAGTQYGWAQLQSNVDSPINTYTVVQYAYADAGDALTVGQVPAPGSMAALALGAAGLGGFRRRRSA